MKFNNKTITQRPNGTWWVRYYENGIQKSIYGKTQKECLNKLKLALGKETKKTKINYLTLEAWVNKWLELYKLDNVKASTLYAMKGRLNGYILNNSIKDRPLKSITTIELQELLNCISAPRQREHICTHLKDIFRKATQTGLITKNPMEFVQIKAHKPKETRAYTLEQEKNFTSYALNYGFYGDFYLLMLFEGIRNGELRALCVEDIDYKNKTITINKTYDDIGNITTPKTEESNRVIPIFDRAYPILAKYKGGSGQLFNVSKCMYQKNFTRLMIIMGWQNEGFTINSGRHTFITRLRENRIEEKLIEKWVGHSENSNVSKKHYIHINPDFEEAKINEINDIMN